MDFQPEAPPVKFTGLRSAQRLLPALLAAAMTMAFVGAPALAQDSPQQMTMGSVQRTPKEPIFQAQLARFDENEYDRAVESLFAAFERNAHHRIAPGPKRRVGLKVYSDSGAGLATPIPLVKAVIAALRRRGFENKNIFLVGLNQLRLRMTGYLPSLVTGNTPFDGNPVYVLESGRYYDPVWFYDSPLPQRFDVVFARQQTQDVSPNTTKDA